jgi:hypothetical protein
MAALAAQTLERDQGVAVLAEPIGRQTRNPGVAAAAGQLQRLTHVAVEVGLAGGVIFTRRRQAQLGVRRQGGRGRRLWRSSVGGL